MPNQNSRRPNKSKELVVVLEDVVKPKQTQGQRKKARKATSNTMSSQLTSIPTQMGMTLTNNTSDKPVRFSRSELLSELVVEPTTPAGTVFTFPLNPAAAFFEKSTLQQLASVFQKYRFRRFSISFSNTTGTNNGGSLIAGYTENPDQAVTTPRQIYAMSGSQTFPMWKPATIPIKVADKNKWYNIDGDSEEIMQTTQGKVVVSVLVQPTTTGPVKIPLIFEYDVEFVGAAVQDFVRELPSAFLGQCSGKGASGGHGPYVELESYTGYTNGPLFATNAGYVSNNIIWSLSNPTDVLVNEAESLVETASFMRVRDWTNNTKMAVQFFRSIEDARVSSVDSSSAIQNVTTGVVVAEVLAQTSQEVL